MLRDIINRIVKGTKKVVTLPTMRTSSGEFLLRKTDFGLVRVEYEVVRRIAERAVSQLDGIQDVAVVVEKSESTITPLKIRLTLTLAEGHSAPVASRDANKAINDALNDTLQQNFYAPIDVKVKQIAPPAEQKRRRVR